MAAAPPATPLPAALEHDATPSDPPQQAQPEPHRVLHTQTLGFCADAAEFCPWPGHELLLALGTYQLIESEQRRVGRCHLLELACDGGGGVPCGAAEAASLDVPGVFDLKWAPAGECLGEPAGPVLGAALADGTVRLLEVQARGGAGAAGPGLRERASAAASASGMALSLDWQLQDGAMRIASSSSSGTVSLLQATARGLELLAEWQAHTLEAWCTAFNRAQPHLLFSGADDSVFKAYDTRTDPATAVFTDRRTHGAGVCTISPHPQRPECVATGSYDEHVRLWDMRNASRPLVTAQANTGGGNWRLRWHPHDPAVLLVACMYNGFAVLRAGGDDFAELSVVDRYQSPNRHIAYGADWWRGRAPGPVQQPAATQEGGDSASVDASPTWLAATCSFYDKLHTIAWLRTQ